METIYDHGVTDKELSVLCFGDPEPEPEEDYLAFLSQDSAHAELEIKQRS